MGDGSLDTLRLGLVALQNLCFAVTVGALLCDRWLVPRTSPWRTGVSRQLTLALRIASIVAVASSVLAFWVHCALMGETALLEAWPAVRSMLAGTSLGHAWLAGATLLSGVAMLSFVSSPDRAVRFPLTMSLALAGVALARSHSGHPVDAGPFSLPVWVDWLHLLAISAWVGLVVVTAYVVAPLLLRAPATERAISAAFIQSLSDAATFALIVLFVTGAYNGWRGVGSPASLPDSAYGQLLLLKLGLVLVAAALGGHNRFVEMPRLLTSLKIASPTSLRRPFRRFVTVLRVEAWVLMGVLAVAAILVSSPLPGPP
ncbi:copper resistance D family protein [Paraburkholderia fungorum]|uniref:Copper resistance protein CopD n=1 Tax=Paraburkholderia fungorum TaxID=134537 RepID=A0A3R7E4K4_9BURK|nr:CopD family protein [Paraburkholderia fungorum]RKF38344.1 copper resistance protein CopD [Paraburkholderia fungorum]